MVEMNERFHHVYAWSVLCSLYCLLWNTTSICIGTLPKFKVVILIVFYLTSLSPLLLLSFLTTTQCPSRNLPETFLKPPSRIDPRTTSHGQENDKMVSINCQLSITLFTFLTRELQNLKLRYNHISENSFLHFTFFKLN